MLSSKQYILYFNDLRQYFQLNVAQFLLISEFETLERQYACLQTSPAQCYQELRDQRPKPLEIREAIRRGHSVRKGGESEDEGEELELTRLEKTWRS